MKVIQKNDRVFVVFDYWEIEQYGYDVKNHTVKDDGFYKKIIGMLDRVIEEYKLEYKEYGIKFYEDKNNGDYIYEICNYDECMRGIIDRKEISRNICWSFIINLNDM